MININNKKQLKVLIFTLIAIITLGVGYAGITAINLVINGDATASVNDQNFKVKFLSQENVTPTITGEGNTVSVKDDTTAGTTHQLEYYNNSSNSKIKQYNSSNSYWWLRSALSSNHNDFRIVTYGGTLSYSGSNYTGGVAPAFRIA